MGTAEQISSQRVIIPRQVEIMDCTLRDGEQTSGVSFLPHEKLVIARKLLSEVNVDRIEVASARVSQGEKEAVGMICRYAKSIGKLDRVEVADGLSTCWSKARCATAPSSSTNRPKSISTTSAACCAMPNRSRWPSIYTSRTGATA